MKKVDAGQIVALLTVTYILMASLPAAEASGYYAPPYDYTSTTEHRPSDIYSYTFAEADTATGKLRALAANYYIGSSIYDTAFAYAQLFREHTLPSGLRYVYYSYYIHGYISSPVFQSNVVLSISVEVHRGWWIFWWWDTVTTYYILNYAANYLTLSQSGSGYFTFNAPDNGALYRLDVKLFTGAATAAMGGSYFASLPNDYATVSVSW